MYRWPNICLFILTGFFAFQSADSNAAESPTLVAATPNQEIQTFHDELASVLEESYLGRIDASMHVIRLDDGEEMFSYQKDSLRIPASTMKVVTAASALRALGPSYRFATELYVDGEKNSAGELDGNLYVKGLGDPTMVVEKLWKLVHELKLQGIQNITGNVIFDEGFFDSRYGLEGWDKKEDVERGPAYFSTLSALSLNFNTVAMVIGPGASVGGTGRVMLETPADGYVELVNKSITGTKGSRRWLEITREITPSGMTFTIEGVLPEGTDTLKIYRTVADPTAHFMAAWKHMEDVHGVKVKGNHERGVVPETATLLHRKQSPPLSVVLGDMNKYSNNFMAEQVLKTIGAEKFGVGSVEKGLRWTRDYLNGLGLTSKDFTLVNGSGLSRDSFLKPTVLTAVLKDMGSDQLVGGEFRASLSIAGLDGTLWRRMRDESGKMRGKTGTINGVHCLSGYFQTADGTEYAYAFLMNGLRGRISRAKKLQDKMLRTMMRSKLSVAQNEGSN